MILINGIDAFILLVVEGDEDTGRSGEKGDIKGLQYRDGSSDDGSDSDCDCDSDCDSDDRHRSKNDKGVSRRSSTCSAYDNDKEQQSQKHHFV